MNGIKQPIFITVPKYVKISANASTNGSSSGSECDSCLDEFLIRGKRKRLDHLTWEEKLQRKKLKNRVAAQTSRDRKKAKMEEMEQTVQDLTDENVTLKLRCDSLQEQNDKLSIRNDELERRLEELEKKFENRSNTQTFCDVSCETITEGSAVSNHPLPQGTVSQLTTKNVRKNETESLWKIIALCLLYKTCSEISTCLDLKSLPKAYLQMSPQNWKMILQKAANELPKMKAPQSECLNEWWGPQQKCWNPAKISIEI